MPEFKFFVSRDTFSRTAYIFLTIIERFKYNFFLFLKNSWKTGTSFGRQSLEIGMPFGPLTCQFEKLARLWHVGTFIGTFIGTLARKNEMLASFWLEGTWARRPHWHAWHALQQIRVSCLMVSKAFCKSIKTPHTISSLFRDFLMVPVKLISVCSVECFEQKPNWFILISLYLQRKE